MPNHKRRSPKENKKPPSIRCFVGIAIPVQQSFKPLWDELEALQVDPNCKLRLVVDENLHLTLKFLGSVVESALPAVDLALHRLATQHAAMTIQINGLGFFKNSIWVGVDADAALNKLAADIDNCCASLGFVAESKPYVPHLTIARIGKDASIKLSTLAEKFAQQHWAAVAVNGFSLFRSETLPEGARYTIISSYPLPSNS